MDKYINRNGSVCLAFLDLQAAFDTVPKGSVWKALRKIGVSVELIERIKSLYVNVNGVVRIAGKTSTQFAMRRGVKQGDSLGPLLFIILMDQVHSPKEKRQDA